MSYNEVYGIYIEKITTISVGGVMVDVHAFDESEEYIFLIDGALCSVQSYCGIRMGSDEEGYDEYLAEIFDERARTAVRNWRTGIGPVYI